MRIWNSGNQELKLLIKSPVVMNLYAPNHSKASDLYLSPFLFL